MSHRFDLRRQGVTVKDVLRNAPPAVLYEEGVRSDAAVITASGALLAQSGEKTGRSPHDKRIAENASSTGDVWWGEVNIALDAAAYQDERAQAIEYLNGRQRLYVVDGFAGWDPQHRLKIRVICARAYHALFMHNMLIRPSRKELDEFGDPDYVIYNAGSQPAKPRDWRAGSTTAVNLCFESGEIVILGTEYAGEMKKGVFTVMHYLMPKQGVFSMHCSANEGNAGDVTLFFGLSGTGKTTLSADADRQLIGDDEHCWSDDGVFNIEGGCYAKCVGLSAAKEPEIHQAIRFGAVLENCVYDGATREVDFADTSITENTRASYPIEFIPHAKTPCLGGHPRNIILLTCDAFGVLPPVSKLSPAQAMYHFISGYTAKVAGTEVGVTEPQATFSTCFGAAFLVWHPMKYAEMLAEKMRRHHAAAWLVNTGWSGGAHGVGERIKLAHTRAIIDAIHAGELHDTPTVEDAVFGLATPCECPGVPPGILLPEDSWTDHAAYHETAAKLAALFNANFEKYAAGASVDVRSGGPKEHGAG